MSRVARTLRHRLVRLVVLQNPSESCLPLLLGMHQGACDDVQDSHSKTKGYFKQAALLTAELICTACDPKSPLGCLV